MFAWLNFLTYTIITAITPGPNTIMSMATAGRVGFKKSLPFILGVWAGFSVVMILCTLFCSLLTAAIAQIKPLMLVLGAIYMLYLAWKIFRSSSITKGNGERGGFVSGALLQFINPKIYIYCIVSMQAYILPHFATQPLTLFAFAMLLAFIGLVCNLCWAGFGSAFHLLFSKYAKITNTVMALLLVYCAVSLFL